LISGNGVHYTRKAAMGMEDELLCITTNI
jgi:hypothetical protein